MPLNINKIGSFITEKVICKPLDYIGNMKAMNGLNKGYQSNNANIIAGVSVASIVLKDGLGGYLYVKQSLNNKDIPDEKRGFVAAMDAVNCVFMIGLQIGMFFLFNKVQDKLFGKFFGKYFNRSALKGYLARLRGHEGMENLTKVDFAKGANKYENTVSSAFKQITSLVVTSIFAKRVLVPLGATPTTDLVKDWFDKKAA